MKNILLFLFLLIGVNIYSQVAINTNGSLPDNSAMLDISGSMKGVLLPRMTSLQREAIVSPAAGLLVFDTDKSCFYYFDGNAWKIMVAVSDVNAPGISKFASDATAGDQFGYSVAINGDYAIVGAPYADVNGHADQGAAYIYFRSGSGWAEQAKIIASNGKANDNFGYSVSIDNFHAVVGAPFRDVPQSSQFFPPPYNIDQGTVYVFSRTGSAWNQQTFLTIVDGAAGDRFGNSVSISDSNLVAGAPYADYISAYPQWLPSTTKAGVAYVFNTTGTSWTLQASLAGGLENPLLPYVSDYGEMGMSVSISGTTMISGAPNARSGIYATLRNGLAFIYHLVNGTWQQEQGDSYIYYTMNELDAIDNYARCGYSVSVGPGGYIMGAPNADNFPTYITDCGSIKSTNSGNYGNGINNFPSYYSYFGVSVSAGTQYLIASSSGGEYAVVYTANPFKFVRKIDKPFPSASAFGTSVAVSGSNIIIGAPRDYGKDVDAGAIYFFNLD
jgi:hypothetical protein